MAIITIKSQKGFDAIPLDTDDIIRIEFGTPSNPAIVRKKYKYTVEARENSTVEVHSSVAAFGNSSVEARGNSSVEAFGNSSVAAFGNSSVEAFENSSVAAFGNSSVVAFGNSSVVAFGNSSVAAFGNSSVVAFENSSVEAFENSSVAAFGNSSVEARGNVQVVDYLQGATIQLFGNARTVYMPRTLDEYMDYYNIKHDETHAFFYKAVHFRNGIYYSNHSVNFQYIIGEKAVADGFDTDPLEDCGKGIHFSHLNWALNFGKEWNNLAILEVKAKISDVILPENSNGKVRAPEVEVVREVPLNECGLFGKILSQKQKR